MAVRRKSLERQSNEVEAKWGLGVAALAGLDAETPITLGSLQSELAQARETADEAKKRLDSLPDRSPGRAGVCPWAWSAWPWAWGFWPGKFSWTPGFGP